MKFHIIFSEYTPKDKHRTRKCWFGRCYSFSNRWFSGSKLILRSVWPYLPFCFCGVRGSLDRGCRMMAQTEMKTETSINSFSEEGVFFPGRGKVFFCLYRWDANIYIYIKWPRWCFLILGGWSFLSAGYRTTAHIINLNKSDPDNSMYSHLLPWKLTFPLKINGWKMYSLLK